MALEEWGNGPRRVECMLHVGPARKSRCKTRRDRSYIGLTFKMFQGEDCAQSVQELISVLSVATWKVKLPFAHGTWKDDDDTRPQRRDRGAQASKKASCGEKSDEQMFRGGEESFDLGMPAGERASRAMCTARVLAGGEFLLLALEWNGGQGESWRCDDVGQVEFTMLSWIGLVACCS